MSNRKKLSRRQFIKSAALGAGAITLTACGGTPETPTAGGSSPASSAAGSAAASVAPSAAPSTAAAATTPVELVWWDGLVTQEPWILDEIKRFEADNPGITVRRIKQPQMGDALRTAFQEKNLPDIFLGDLGEGGTLGMITQGYLKPISDFPDYNEFVQTYPNPSVDFVDGRNIIDGKTYGAPFEARGGMWNMLYMNTKVFKDAGVVDASGEAKAPATMDEMIDAMKKIKEASGGSVYGFATPMSEFLGAFFPWWWGIRSGAAFDGTDPMTGKSIYGENPVFNRILEFFVQARDESWIHPQSATANDEAIRALFAEGEIGLIPGGAWNLNGWQQSHPEFKEYRPIVPPLINTDKQLGWYGADPGGEYMRLGSTSKNPEAAWKLFKHIHSKEASRRYVQSGNGSSIWPENNDPSLMGTPAQQEYFRINTENTRLNPYRYNADMSKVSFPAAKPDEVATLQGVFSGQIADVEKALDELGAAKNAAREQGFADAKAAGAKNVGFEYLAQKVQFPNYDPTAGKDYIP